MHPSGISAIEKVVRELSQSPPKSREAFLETDEGVVAVAEGEDVTTTTASSIAAAATLTRRNQEDAADWVQKWTTCYQEWSTAMELVNIEYGLSKKDGRAQNALKLIKIYEGFCDVETQEAQQKLATLNKIRRMVRGSQNLVWDFRRDEQYMQRQGYCEAFNMATFGMGWDAANAKLIKDQRHFELDNFGAVFMMLFHISDSGHIKLMREYKNNKDAFPERDANFILASALEFSKKLIPTSVEFDNCVSIPQEMKDCVPKLVTLIIESTPE